MSNIYSLLLSDALPLPVGMLPFGVDHEFWQENDDRKAFVADIARDELSTREEDEWELYRMVETPKGTFAWVGFDRMGERMCTDCEGHYSVYINQNQQHDQLSKEQADQFMDAAIREADAVERVLTD